MWCGIYKLGYRPRAYSQLRDALLERIVFMEGQGYEFYRLYVDTGSWPYKGFVLQDHTNVVVDKAYVMTPPQCLELFIGLVRLLLKTLSCADVFFSPAPGYYSGMWTIAYINACRYYNIDEDVMWEAFLDERRREWIDGWMTAVCGNDVIPSIYRHLDYDHYFSVRPMALYPWNRLYGMIYRLINAFRFCMGRQDQIIDMAPALEYYDPPED